MIAHAVSRRTQEIGVRMAVGATPLDVLRSVLAQTAVPLPAGIPIGLAGAMVTNRPLSATLVGVLAADPLTLATAPLIPIVPAIVACLAPARRAIRIDPVVALRHQ